MTSSARPVARPGCAGVTLIELMIVLVVLTVGILALSGIQTSSSRDVYTTGLRTRAVAVAQTQMEIARSLGFALAVPDSGLADGFNWRADVDSVNVGLNRVTVTVSWTEKGTPSSVQLVDLLASR